MFRNHSSSLVEAVVVRETAPKKKVWSADKFLPYQPLILYP